MGLGDSDGAAWRVFISHTSELREFPPGTSYVAAVERAISAAGHVIVNMADFPAADQPAAQVCAERVRGCEVYIGLLGTRYGSLVRDRPGVSYTELEFDTATAARMDRLVFLLDVEAADVGIPVRALIDHESGAQQEAFRRRVRDSGLVTGSFASPAALGQLVERSLRELARSRGGTGPRQTGAGRRVWNIPARNPGFTGRDGLLAAVRERMLGGDRAVVQALHGMGGVGKTQLAAEYAHRFAGSYDLAWWVNSERAGLMGDQFAALGAALGCVQAGAGTEAVRAAVLAELRDRGRWLLVFDNAESPAGVRPWLPGGGGHVLITSRERGWAEIAAPVEVDVLARAESVAILQDRVAGLAGADAERLAAELGDLPLAIAQAAGFMAETGMAAAEYLDLLRTRAGQLLDQGAPGSYPRSLAAATGLIADRLAAEDPAAAELASLCAFLAPEPIPEDLFTGATRDLPCDLAGRAADQLAWRQTLARLARQSLARVDYRGLQMHRLTQAILRDRLSPKQAAGTRTCTEAILAASNPLYAAARDLDQDTWKRSRRVLGEDHPDTLVSASNLALCLRALGEVQAARELDEDTLARSRRVLGEDHPFTLAYANGLAADLRASGRGR